MADYFPLISRAIAALDPNTPQRREAIYARARDALERQLRGLDPPIPENDLKRERAVLDDTIRRVEAHYAAPPVSAPPPAADAPPAAPGPEAGASAEPAAPAIEQANPAAAEPAAAETVAVQRPKVAAGATRGFFSDFRKMTALVVAIPVVILIAVAAYFLRDDPARFAPQTAGAQADAGAPAPRKTGGRLDGTGGSGPVAGPTRPVAPANDAAIPVASRALFFEESPDNPQGLQSDGIVVWRTENVAGGPGRPLTSAVRGSVTVSKANIGLELVIKKNLDTALPASHTVEVVFKPEAGRDGIKDLGPIEARTQENQPGFALQGAMVPIGENLFLVGLDNSEAVVQKNIDAMRDTKWFAFQFRTVKGRLGAVLIEKGLTGDKVLRDALEQWR